MMRGCFSLLTRLSLALLFFPSCSLFAGLFVPRECEDGAPARCEGNRLVRCIDGVEFKTPCGELTCDPVLESCGACGDGSTAPAEACDDGNLTDGDGCTERCQVEEGHFFEREPNDHPALANGPLEEPIIIHAAINPPEDVDFFSLELTRTTDLALETFDADPLLSSCSGGIDTLLHLFAPDQKTRLVSDDEDGISSCSRIDPEFDPEVRRLPPGTYYISVQDFGGNNAIDGYQLLITFVAVCGNGVQEGFEACDDGNLDDGDGCDASCVSELCGDGNLNEGEECDDGNLIDGDGCESDCTLPACRNGIKDPGEICFGTPLSATTEDEPTSLIAEDFDGDFLLDLAVVHTGQGTISLLINEGAGQFFPFLSFPAGPTPTALVAGAFSEGLPDLVVANTSADQISFLANQDGAFDPPQGLSVGPAPTALAVGEFSGDALLDLAVAHPGTGEITILHNQGEGQLTTAQTILVTPGISAIAAGDFNGDLLSDVVAISSLSGEVFFLKNEGNGQLSLVLPGSPSGMFPTALAVGEFSGDALPDLIVADGAGGEIFLLENQGAGTFAFSRSLLVAPAPRTVVVEDFNQDLFPDVAVLDTAGVTLLAGEGGGLFAPPISFPLSGAPHTMIAGEFSGDLLPDIVVTDFLNARVLLLPSDP